MFSGGTWPTHSHLSSQVEYSTCPLDNFDDLYGRTQTLLHPKASGFKGERKRRNDRPEDGLYQSTGEYMSTIPIRKIALQAY